MSQPLTSVSKTVSLILALLFSNPTGAIASPNSIDQADARLTELIGNISTEKGAEWAGKDAHVSAANDQLIKYLTLAGNNEQLLTAPLKQTQKSSLSIIDSPDKMLRVYNWDSLTGGTCQFLDCVVQYATGTDHKTKAVLLHPKPRNLKASDGENLDPAYSYRSIRILHTVDGRTVYVLVGSGKGSTIDWNISLEAYTVKNGDFVKYPLFHTAAGTSSQIQRYFHQFADGPAVDNADCFVLSKDGKTLKVPEVTDDGRATAKSLLFKFDGKTFR